MNKISFLAAATCAAVLVAGCRENVLVTAEGTVQHRGTPLDGASVTVHYADGNVAQDVTHDGGKFSLTYNGKPGTRPGTKLKVRVNKVAATYSAPPRSDSTPPNPANRVSADSIAIMEPNTAAVKTGGRANLPKPAVDAQYELTIPEGGSKSLKIDLP